MFMYTRTQNFRFEGNFKLTLILMAYSIRGVCENKY